MTVFESVSIDDHHRLPHRWRQWRYGVRVHVLAIFGKILLFLAGWPMVLDLIGPRKLGRWKENADERRKRVATKQEQVREARTVNPLIRRMARLAAARMAPRVIVRMTRHATAEQGLQPEDLVYLTIDQFTAWIHDARVELVAEGTDPREYTPDYLIPRLTDSARRFMIRNDRVPCDIRKGLSLIERDLQTRRRRHWRIGVTLFGLVVPATVVLLWLTNEHNSVEFFADVLSAGVLALCLWGSLLSLTVLLGFQAAGATTRILLARTACALVGKDDKEKGNKENEDEKMGRPMRWAALAAFVVGALLDFIATVL